MTLSTGADKVLDKIQHIFLIKTRRKKRGELPQVYEELLPNITPNSNQPNAFSSVKLGTSKERPLSSLN